MLRIVRRFVLTCLLGAALLPGTVSAQGSPALERVEIALWPEYDQRAMLVIYRVTLPAETALPATILVPIPARVGEPGAVAQESGDGVLVLADYTRAAPAGDWATLTIGAESTRLQIEFYDALSIEGDQRAYTLTWPAGWPVGELAFEVQQPFGVASMQIDPAPAGTRVGPDGLTYYAGTLVARDGTPETSLQLSYTASASGLTVDALPAGSLDETPAIGAAQMSGPGSPWLEWAPWLFGGLGAALLVAAAVLLLRTRGREGGRRRPRRKPSEKMEHPSPTIDAPTVFCHSCGAPAGARDLFCRKCGTRLRV